MNVTYKNGEKIVTHNSGVVTVHTIEQCKENIESRRKELKETQESIDLKTIQLNLMEASKTNSNPIVTEKE